MQANNYTQEQYNSQWQTKLEKTCSLFTDLNVPSPQTFESAIKHYRMRAEFKVWHTGDEWNYIMFEPNNKHKHYTVSSFAIADESIEKLMPLLRQHVIANKLLSHRLFQVEFLCTTTKEMLVSLIYHKKLDDNWLIEAQKLADVLGIKIIGRARKQKLCTHVDYVTESLKVNETTYHYQQVEASFTQPNAGINTHMLSWACDQLGNNTTDLLELYCGNGNFTMPLAKRFKHVIATEISKTSVNSALYNCKLNNVDNITFLRMSSEEFTEALNGVRTFRRLKDVDLNDYKLHTVVVDPPRAGLDDDTVELIRKFDRILYISCNPKTLVANLNALQCDFDIKALAFFDQFPYTDHIESGVVLTKK